jgi:Zn finger protein HypA/HybF involved in hydrogenase expression
MKERFNYINNFNKILEGEVKAKYSSSLRNLIFKSNLFVLECSKCKIKKWNGESITLEVEHKNGDHNDNSKDNLELLCPNCHSQTKTYRKKKIKEHKKNVTDFQILEILKKPNIININQVINELQMSNSGGNYRRLHEIIKKNSLEDFYNLPNIRKNKKETLQEKYLKRIKIIENTKIDFSKNGWAVKLSKEFDITPFACRRFIKKHLPQFWEECAKHN